MMASRWWSDGLRATGLQWLQDTNYNQIDHDQIDHEMCSAFVERWHAKTSSFHFPFGEITVKLDDVSYLLHLPIDGMILSHESMTRVVAIQVMVEHLGADARITWKEVTKTKGGDAWFNYLKRIFKERLL